MGEREEERDREKGAHQSVLDVVNLIDVVLQEVFEVREKPFPEPALVVVFQLQYLVALIGDFLDTALKLLLNCQSLPPPLGGGRGGGTGRGRGDRGGGGNRHHPHRPREILKTPRGVGRSHGVGEAPLRRRGVDLLVNVIESVGGIVEGEGLHCVSATKKLKEKEKKVVLVCCALLICEKKIMPNNSFYLERYEVNN